MFKPIKRKWCKALRSKKYEQSCNRLKDSVGFCCLGVLTDIYLKETGGEWEKQVRGRGAYLPAKVKKWAGLTSNDPVVDARSLSEWNDHTGATFSKIADKIEEYL